MTFLPFPVAIVCAVVAALVWRRRVMPGAIPLVVLLAAVAEWNFAYGLEIAAEELATKLWWAKLQYVGIVSAPVAVFVFAAEYTGGTFGTVYAG